MSELREAFYKEYGKSGVWLATFWLGRHVYKCPTDLWIYQELLHVTRPDLIIETGTFSGGSALFLASMCDLLDEGRIITIDIEPQPDLPEHPRIKYLKGSSVAPEILEQVRAEASAADGVMVILDSDHSRDHVRGRAEGVRAPRQRGQLPDRRGHRRPNATRPRTGPG